MAADQNAKESLERVDVAKDLIENSSNDIELLIKGIKESADTNLESVKLVGELERQSGNSRIIKKNVEPGWL
ncbi:MAG: hypothetical protein PVG90_05550 [Bacillota bacterium]|jgi:methyl-accepting chemotaxis protein